LLNDVVHRSAAHTEAEPSAVLGLLVGVHWVQRARTRNRPLGKDVRFVFG
jgi:hypothetical protein